MLRNFAAVLAGRSHADLSVEEKRQMLLVRTASDSAYLMVRPLQQLVSWYEAHYWLVGSLVYICCWSADRAWLNAWRGRTLTLLRSCRIRNWCKGVPDKVHRIE